MKVKCVACYKVTYKTIWLMNMIFRFKVVENTSKTLTICCNNVVIVNFPQMIKVLPTQCVLILSINLLERRYASIVFIAINHILANLLRRSIGVQD